MGTFQFNVICLEKSKNDRMGNEIAIQISDKASILDLKNAIKAETSPLLDMVTASNMDLWKLTSPMYIGIHIGQRAIFYQNILTLKFPDPNSAEDLDGSERAQFLIPTAYIADYWPNHAEFEKKWANHLHIVVRLPSPSPPRTEPSQPGRNQTSEILSTKQAAYAKIINSMPGPSSAAEPSYFKKHNEGQKPRLLNLRPSHARGPPINLFHPIFDEFLNNLEASSSSSSPPSDYFETIVKFMKAAANLYNDERERRNAMRPLLETLVGCTFNKGPLDNGGEIDDVTTIDEFYPIILEYKREMGTGHNDGTIQAGFGYAKWAAQPKIDKFRPYSCLPAILLGIEGPWLCVLGATFHATAIVEPLTDFVFCADRPLDEGDRIFVLAKIFTALSKVRETLSAYYKTVKASSITRHIPDNSPMFPYRTTFNVNGETTTLSYTRWLYEEKLVWEARTSRNEDVIVKFARKYSFEAHQLLAAVGLAPPIYYAERDSSRRYQMIVMQRVVGADLNHVPPTNRSYVLGRLKDALEILHQNGYVFGDLRPPNIMVTNDYKEVKLIDFDWCGKEGIARYPAGGVNKEHAWADGVAANGLIKYDHDQHLYQVLQSGF